MANTDTDPVHEDEIDLCGQPIDDADVTADEDLPVAVGGVE